MEDEKIRYIGISSEALDCDEVGGMNKQPKGAMTFAEGLYAYQA